MEPGVGKVGIIAFFQENIRFLVQDELVDMPAVAGFAEKGLGHEGHEEVVFLGQVEQDIFDDHRLVGCFEQGVEFRLDLVLVDGDFVVVVLDLNAKLLQQGHRFIFKIDIFVLGRTGMILIALGLAVFFQEIVVPVLEHSEFGLLENKKLEFRPEHGMGTDLGLGQGFLGLTRYEAGILGKPGARRIGQVNIRHEYSCFSLAERINDHGFQIGDHDHVALFRLGETIRRSIEADSAADQLVIQHGAGENEGMKFPLQVERL